MSGGSFCSTCPFTAPDWCCLQAGRFRRGTPHHTCACRLHSWRPTPCKAIGSLPRHSHMAASCTLGGLPSGAQQNLACSSAPDGRANAEYCIRLQVQHGGLLVLRAASGATARRASTRPQLPPCPATRAHGPWLGRRKLSLRPGRDAALHAAHRAASRGTRDPLRQALPCRAPPRSAPALPSQRAHRPRRPLTARLAAPPTAAWRSWPARAGTQPSCSSARWASAACSLRSSPSRPSRRPRGGCAPPLY